MQDRLEYFGRPVAKPRMVRSDKYKKRPVVLNYWAFKDRIVLQAKRQGFKLGKAYKVTFVMQMPQGILDSQALSERYDGTPHKVRPDLDNMLKALNDCLSEEDSDIHYVVCNKIWGKEGKIIVENLEL